MQILLGIILAGLAAGAMAPPQAVPASPPIFQPGAPGAAARVITPGQAVALSRSTHTDADVAFMQHMIVHHGQAVAMVDLLQQYGADSTVRMMGRRIALGQAAEIALMRDWLRARDLSTAMPEMPEMPDMPDGAGMAGMDHSAHAGMAMLPSDVPIMPGMLSPAQMQALAAARGPAFDRLFLEGMIRHHQGALDMVEALLARPGTAEDPLLSDFTSSVVADQSTEILRMQSLLSDL